MKDKKKFEKMKIFLKEKFHKFTQKFADFWQIFAFRKNK